VSVQIPRLIRSIALVVATVHMFGMSIGSPVNVAHADDCLAAPNSPSPEGRHWYYRLDWQTQRKCWYVRARGHHSVARSSTTTYTADSAPMSVSSRAPDTASSDIKVLAVNPQIAPATSSTENNQQAAIAAPALESRPLQSMSSRSRDQAAESPAAVIAWPDPPPVVATNNDAERTGLHNDQPGNNVRNPMMIVFPVLALGLAGGAILARFLKGASGRRALVAINRPDLNQTDDQAQRKWLGDQRESETIDERRALASALSDQGSLGSDNVPFQIRYEISKRKAKLAQLHQNLDRLLQSLSPA
jgi:hypothetical protein